MGLEIGMGMGIGMGIGIGIETGVGTTNAPFPDSSGCFAAAG